MDVVKSRGIKLIDNMEWEKIFLDGFKRNRLELKTVYKILWKKHLQTIQKKTVYKFTDDFIKNI
jgi:hypothetical protein